MILLIDNYDSFSYNLYQLIGSVEPEVKVIRNDDCTLGEIEAMQPEALILSPGPGRPEDAGICIPASSGISPESCRFSASAWVIRRSVRHLAAQFLTQNS